MKKLLALLVIILVCLFSCSASSKKHEKNFVKAAKSAKSVVLLNIYKKNDTTYEMESYGFGSGVVINNEGYIVSCNHVTYDGDSIVVISGNDTITARLVGGSKITDMSLLKVNKKLTPIKIGKSKNLQLGENVLSIGCPAKLGISVSSGIVSNLIPNGSKYNLPPIPYIQTDATVNPGSSGGALINEEGELVGITEMIVSPTGYYIGYSFAIPIDFLKAQIDYAISMDKILNKGK